MPVHSDRVSHTAVCIAAFVIYHSLFYVVVYIPGIFNLYRLDLIGPFIHLALLLPCALLLWRHYGRHYRGLLPFGTLSAGNIILPLLALAAILTLQQIFWQPEPWADSLAGYTGFTRWAWIVTACLAAPVSEEIIFRGFLLNASRGWGKLPQQVGIVITSGLFAASHMQYQAPMTFIHLFIFSAILCVVRIGTGGLVVPILLHVLANLIFTVMLYLQ